jgi:virulence factor Mce-like protein
VSPARHPSQPAPRRRRQRATHPLIAAALVILGTVAITYYAFNEGLPFVHGFQLHAVVSQAQSLRSDSPVRIAGVDVGTVQGVSRGPNHTADVTMSLDNSALPIHSDATIRVRPRLFLEGSSYVDLFAGSPSAPVLKDGGTVPLAQTSVAVQAYQVLSTFNLPTRSELQGMLRVLSQALGHGGAAGLRAASPQLAPAFTDVAWVSQAARGLDPHDLSNFIHSAANVTSALSSSRTQLASLVGNLNTTATALAATGNALGQSISGIDAVLREAPPDLAAIDHALPPLTALGQALDPVLKASPPLLVKISGAVDQLAALVAPAERTRLLGALRGVFISLPTLVQRLGGLFPVVKPVTDCIHSHVAPILLSKVPDGNLSSGQPVWQEFAHALVGLAGASQNFDANGFTLRILIGAGAQLVTSVLPGLGKVVTVLPGSGAILGARPAWVGDLTPDDFHPEARCTAQRIPTLASATAAPDFGGGTP